jgi:hypothetical protein
MVVTTTNIIAVILSNKKDQFTSNKFKFIQVKSVKLTMLFDTAISKKANQESKTVKNMKNTAIKEPPSRPTNRPKKEIKKKEINGKKIISRYILIQIV